MRFGIFYEHQNPRPWEDERSEHALLRNALDQIELADRLGFDYVWEVEHHFLEEYSHSSAPEVFLAAASQRTERIRLGHGIVQIPPAVNHPARVAERVATLDLVSDGRVDFGTGESSSGAELGGFWSIARPSGRCGRTRSTRSRACSSRSRSRAGTPSSSRCRRETSSRSRSSSPHPPLWVACSRRETIHFAARNGIGALSFAFVEPEDAGDWVREYYELIASEECVPAGFAVNPSVAVVLPMMCHADEQEAIERGIDGAHFFGYSLAHFYGMGRHQPGVTDVWADFEANRAEKGFAREIVNADNAPLGVRLMQQGLGSLRGAIGTPDQIRDMVRRYEAVGVDQMIFVLQAGRNRHEDICESLELFANEVMPEFAERAEQRESERDERLAGAIEAALQRRDPPRQAPEGYTIDEPAELERARRARAGRSGLRERAAAAASDLKQHAARQGREGFARLVRGSSPEQLERRFGNQVAQRMIFGGMARRFDPKLAQGFEGDIVYELEHHTDGGPARPPTHWTIRIRGDSAAAVPEDSEEAVVRFRFALPDFIRLLAGDVLIQELMFDDRFGLEGDVGVAQRLPVMFGEVGTF